MTLRELYELIELQKDTVKRLDVLLEDFELAPYKDLIADLTTRERAGDAYKTLKEMLGDDPLGMKILACYLDAALITYENYAALGIDDGVYADTMKCFTRFINEDIEREGKPSFGRAFWNYRHLNCTLFRIGALEYELLERNGERKISVHIPSDADLSPESLDESFACARRFISAKFPDYADAVIYCESWLMYPTLHELLPEGSRILGFQDRFEITRVNSASSHHLVYIFHRADCTDLSALSEDTSLQRRVKKYLIEGGGICSAYGVYKGN